eukprot:gene6434-biopygen13675
MAPARGPSASQLASKAPGSNPFLVQRAYHQGGFGNSQNSQGYKNRPAPSNRNALRNHPLEGGDSLGPAIVFFRLLMTEVEAEGSDGGGGGLGVSKFGWLRHRRHHRRIPQLLGASP